MLVKDALKLINQVREEITAPATGEYDPETLFALDWFAAKGFEKGRSGDAIVMTNAVNVSLDGMNAAGFFLADGGVARLLKRELPDDWDPANDNRATVWEACQHLIKRLRAEERGVCSALPRLFLPIRNKDFARGVEGGSPLSMAYLLQPIAVSQRARRKSFDAQAFDKRRKLMDAWAAYCAAQPKSL